METKHTPIPWVLQKLNHAENEPWYQIGWLENGSEVGPICELSGGAVRSRLPLSHPVAEFKYLIASEEEIKANGEIIVQAVNSHASLTAALDGCVEALKTAKIALNSWNALSGPDDPAMTKLYAASPEMRAVDAALEAAKKARA